LRFRVPAGRLAGRGGRRRARAARRLSCRHDRSPGGPVGSPGTGGGGAGSVPPPRLGGRPVAWRGSLASPSLSPSRVGAANPRSPAGALPHRRPRLLSDVARDARRRASRPAPWVVREDCPHRARGPWSRTPVGRGSPAVRWSLDDRRRGRRPRRPGPLARTACAGLLPGRRRPGVGHALRHARARDARPESSADRGAHRAAVRAPGVDAATLGDPTATHLHGSRGRHAQRHRRAVRDDGGEDRRPQQHQEPVAHPPRTGAQAPLIAGGARRAAISAGRTGNRKSPRGRPPG